MQYQWEKFLSFKKLYPELGHQANGKSEVKVLNEKKKGYIICKQKWNFQLDFLSRQYQLLIRQLRTSLPDSMFPHRWRQFAVKPWLHHTYNYDTLLLLNHNFIIRLHLKKIRNETLLFILFCNAKRKHVEFSTTIKTRLSGFVYDHFPRQHLMLITSFKTAALLIAIEFGFDHLLQPEPRKCLRPSA